MPGNHRISQNYSHSPDQPNDVRNRGQVPGETWQGGYLRLLAEPGSVAFRLPARAAGTRTAPQPRHAVVPRAVVPTAIHRTAVVICRAVSRRARALHRPG